MKADLKSQILKMLLYIVGAAVLGTLLLTLVFCIPTDKMEQNVAVSIEHMITEENETESNFLAEYIRTKRETYTDAIMVQNAIDWVDGKNIYEHAMWAYHHDLESEFWTPEDSLKALCNQDDTSQMYVHEYSRYWHGYLIYLKPLLLLFSWTEIVYAGLVFQIAMLVAVLVIAIRKKYVSVCVSMLIGVFFLKPELLVSSLTMAVCFIITLATILIMLLKHDKLEQQGKYPDLFLLVGIIVAYFDFLTYPVVSLGFPLCVYFLIKKEESIMTNIKKVIAYSIHWGIGYVGMWAMKWIIADITLHTGTIKDALWSIIGRTEAIGGRPRMNGGFYVISLNLQEYDWVGYSIVAVIVAVLSLLAVIAAWRKVSVKPLLPMIVALTIIFCIPFVWIIVVQHHSALHARFTFRIIGIAAMAVATIGTFALQKLRNVEKA